MNWVKKNTPHFTFSLFSCFEDVLRATVRFLMWCYYPHAYFFEDVFFERVARVFSCVVLIIDEKKNIEREWRTHFPLHPILCVLVVHSVSCAWSRQQTIRMFYTFSTRWRHRRAIIRVETESTSVFPFSTKLTHTQYDPIHPFFLFSRVNCEHASARGINNPFCNVCPPPCMYYGLTFPFWSSNTLSSLPYHKCTHYLLLLKSLTGHTSIR